MRTLPSILNVNNYHYPRGGSDRYFLQLTSLLKDAGHRVGTFAARHANVFHADWLVVPPPEGVDTDRIGSACNLLRYIYSSAARRNMAEAITKFDPDIAHLHIYYGQLTSGILEPLRRAGIPIIQTLHEFKLVCPTQGLFAKGMYCDACRGTQYWHALFKKCNRDSVARSALSMIESYVSDKLGAKNAVDQFVSVSRYQKRELVRLGVPEDKIVTIHHFADVSSAAPTSKGRYFLYVGRIVGAKGLGVLLQAYKMIGNHKLKLKIVGDGSEIGLWKDQAHKLGIAQDVEWLGFRFGEELERLYSECLAVVNPSVLNETFGLTCLEALSKGRPVIASRVGAFPEVVSDGNDGILFPAGDSSALANAMSTLASRPADALSMGRQGWRKVKDCFSRKQHYEGLMDVYRRFV